jgi:hypothetical protein
MNMTTNPFDSAAALDYVVEEGDCIASIAADHGHFWKTLWNDPANAALKTKRQDPNVLMAGDVVKVPPLRQKQQSRATDQRHPFKRLGIPAKLRLRVMQEPEPDDTPPPEAPLPVYSGRDVITEDAPAAAQSRPDRGLAGASYVLDVDGTIISGTTDGQGNIEVPMPPNARFGKLVINPGTLKEREIALQLGQLDPITEVSGVKQRLANLGFDCGDRSGESTPGLAAAIRAFQDKCGAEVSGELDENLRQLLSEAHGS